AQVVELPCIDARRVPVQPLALHVVAQVLDLLRLGVEPGLQRADPRLRRRVGLACHLLAPRRQRHRRCRRQQCQRRPAPPRGRHGDPAGPTPARPSASPKFIACTSPSALVAASTVAWTWMCAPSSEFCSTSPAPVPAAACTLPAPTCTSWLSRRPARSRACASVM